MSEKAAPAPATSSAPSGGIDPKVRRDLDIARAELEGQSPGAKEKVSLTLGELAARFGALGGALGGLFKGRPSAVAMDALDGTIDGVAHEDLVDEPAADAGKVRSDLDAANAKLTGQSEGHKEAAGKPAEASAEAPADPQKVAEALEKAAGETLDKVEKAAGEAKEEVKATAKEVKEEVKEAVKEVAAAAEQKTQGFD
ncbi:hypothetical protein DFJ74DRAFT_704475 [Hyaloraphidium curvatum]|nr:hypothetical protein DFJ74DRAFT_704475 [Hyaloraphidium curvatum]